ncbi:methylated-DNA--[protein]-cysteine S-methyltransferase [Baekduia soli]|uniref:methylated-DNA--[protein]-cysteine S-methyltransferase n=1 Tax=Baekduia soli TaxID=496014 RepID=UPI001E435CEF|nr:methylated-DNA--[protein]-cysteine S-methyltransferase [Baekduia soli]
MTDAGSTLFDTAIGACGIAWGPQGVTAVALPAAAPAATRAWLRRRSPEAVPGPAPEAVRAAIDAIRALLDGEPRDLREVVLDVGGLSPFDRDVYAAARDIVPGQTCTYGEIAARLGDPGAARAVGGALGRNPFPIVVPCHRVVAAGGRAGGFSAPGGRATKLAMLDIERVHAAGATLF